MALNMKPDTQIVFFKQVFGNGSVTMYVEALAKLGVTFQTSLYSVAAEYNGLKFKVSTTLATTTLMKSGSASSELVNQNKKMIADWVVKICKLKLSEAELIPLGLSNQPGTFADHPGQSKTVGLGGMQVQLAGPQAGTFMVGPPAKPFQSIGLSEYQSSELSEPYSLILANSKKLIDTVKALRWIFGLAPKEAKDLADKAPIVLKSGLAPIEAELILGMTGKLGLSAVIVNDSKVEHWFQTVPEAFTGVYYLDAELSAKLTSTTLAALTAGSLASLAFVGGAQDKNTAIAFSGFTSPVPTGGVIHLRDAKAIGQKVHGTTGGSIYHAIAINQRVKVAARISLAGTISLRVECDDPQTDELVRVKQAVEWKSTYGSTHMQAGDIPVARCIGAFLMGLGIEFDAQVQHEKQLVFNA